MDPLETSSPAPRARDSARPRNPTTLIEVIAALEYGTLVLGGGHRTSGVVVSWSSTSLVLADHEGTRRDLIAIENVMSVDVVRSRPATAPSRTTFTVDLERAALHQPSTCWLTSGAVIPARRVDAIGDDVVLLMTTEGRSLAVALRSLALVRLSLENRTHPLVDGSRP